MNTHTRVCGDYLGESDTDNSHLHSQLSQSQFSNRNVPTNGSIKCSSFFRGPTRFSQLERVNEECNLMGPKENKKEKEDIY